MRPAPARTRLALARRVPTGSKPNSWCDDTTRFRVVVFTIKIRAPLPDIAVHIIKPERIRLKAGDRRGERKSVVGAQCIFVPLGKHLGARLIISVCDFEERPRVVAAPIAAGR